VLELVAEVSLLATELLVDGELLEVEPELLPELLKPLVLPVIEDELLAEVEPLAEPLIFVFWLVLLE
jgi:hypothetical protein